ncbi:MAG: hypothetical protein NVS4B12_19580 [Ktedonobacteraceae bacterium]
MTTQVQGQRKRFTGWRLVVGTAGIMLIVVALVVGILIKLGTIKGDPWFDILSYVFGGLGLILTLVAWLFPLSPLNESEPADTMTNTPPIQVPMPTSFTFSPSITVSPSITMNPNQSVLPQQQPSLPQQVVAADKPQENATPAHTNTQMNTVTPAPQPSAPPDLVFPFNAPLNNPNEFYGRTLVRTTLTNRTHMGGSTAIVGERRIGKTWLLRYLMLTAPNDTMLGTNYRIGYLDATSPYCHTVTDFVMKALEKLDILPTTPLQEKANLKTLEDAIAKRYQQQQIRSVLCIDEFEGFGQHKEFDLDFLAGLRAMTQEGLVLITVTRAPLMDVVASILGEQSRTSPFFNIFHSLMLKSFDIRDAETFTQAKSIQAGFNEQERQYVLERSVGYEPNGTKHWYPLKLQLVGRTLLEDKQAGQTDPTSYRPQDVQYWLEFEQRVKEQYGFVVKL